MKNAGVAFGLFAVAAAIVFATWYPSYKEDERRRVYVSECLDEYSRVRQSMGIPSSSAFGDRDLCLKEYHDLFGG